MKVAVDLHGWADSLTGNQKIIFALQLAMVNSGYGLGYDIKFTSRSIDDSHMVNKPWAMTATATTVTSRGYDLKRDIIKDEIKETVYFEFIAQAYSVREIYLGAMLGLKDRRKVHRNCVSMVMKSIKNMRGKRS